jgi:hypothetical protein
MGGDYTTAWKRKVKKFEKKYGKRAEKAKKEKSAIYCSPLIPVYFPKLVKVRHPLIGWQQREI